MKHLTMVCAVFLLVCAAGSPAQAQDVASSFEELGVLVRAGDKITVFDVSGSKADGRIGKLSRDMLTLMTRDGPRQLNEADIAEIRQRRTDSLLNGAIIGALGGAASSVGVIAILVETNESGSGAIIVPAVAAGVLFVGLGAAAGAGIDALITRQQVIYRNPFARSGIRVSPMLGRGRLGAAVTVRF